MTAPIRCHYATEPSARPDCQLVAVVRYRHIALCASCDKHRSTLGKGQQPVRLNATEPIDVLAWIDQAQRELRTAEQTLAAAVHRARQQGHPWSAIGKTLGISRQAAQQRFAPSNPNIEHPGGARSSRHGGAKSS
jgi:hypothetical protein